MAVDAYMMFQKSTDKTWLSAESQVDFTDTSPLAMDGTGQSFSAAKSAGNLFEVTSYSFGIHQALNISSQSQGLGAGKVDFQSFSLLRKVDKSSPVFYQMACAGTPFSNVTLFLFKSTGAGGSGSGGSCFLRYDFKLVGVSSISWTHDQESPSESLTLEYGALQIRYSVQDATGKMGAPIPGMWNKISNTNTFVVANT